jgi:outer membrane lipoprotein-sorting protein
MEAIALTIQMEQVFRKPGTILLMLDLFGAGLRQTFLTEESVEQSYNPVQGIIVEKRFKNLEKASSNPLLALQASMYELGRRIRSARSQRVAGTDTVLGYACDILELESRELLHDMSPGGILGGQRGADLKNGRTKVWLIREYGLPVRIVIFTNGEKPTMSVAFTELKVNTGVTNAELNLGAPNGTRKVSVTADLTDPDWEKKMEEDLRQLLSKAAGDRSGKTGGS